MKKVGRIILIIIIILQNIAPNIVIASETQMSKEQFQFVDVELTNSDEDISATIKGSYSKSNEEESIDKIHVSDNIKLADSTNNLLTADDGSTKGTYDILNNVITLKVKSAGNYSVKVNLSGKYNLDSQNDQVTFSHGNKSITKELKGLRPLVATVDAPDAENKISEATAKESETDKKDSSEQPTEISDEADPDTETTVEKQNKAIPADANWVTGVELKINGQTIENGGTGSVELTGENAIQLNYDLEIPQDNDNLAGETYSLTLPDIFKDMSSGRPISLNAEGKTIGSYLIQDGKIVITFSEEADNLGDIKININIPGLINESVFENKDEVDVNIPFSDGHEYNSTIEVKQVPYDGTDKKEAGKPYVLDDNGEKVYTNKNPEYVDWTVRANDSMEEIKDAKVIDKLGDNLEILQDSLKIEKIIRDRNNKETGRETVTRIKPEIKNPGFELNLGSISDAYDITYTTKITRPEGGGKLTVNNNASIVIDDDSKDYSDKVDVEFSKDIPTIQKDGAVSKDNADIVNWTVKYNFGKESIGTVNLTDKLDVGTVDSNSIKVVQVNTNIDGNIIPGTEKEVTVTPSTDADGNVVISSLDANGKAYLITFDSKVPVGTNGTIINKISDDQSNTDDAKVDVNTIPTGGKVGEQKVDENGNPYIEWTITANTNRVNTPSINIKDVFNQKYLTFDVKDSSLYDLYRDGKKVDGNSYTVSDYSHEEDGRKGFQLNITPAGAHEFKFVYRTYYTLAGMQQPELANHAELIFNNGNGGTIGPEEGIDYNITGPKAGINKSGQYKYNPETRKQEIEWKITFNTSKINLGANAQLIDEFTSKNYSYISGSMKIKANNEEFSDYTLDTANPNPGFTINLTKDTNATFEVVYRTTADDTENKAQKNVAILKWQGGDESSDATVGKRDPGIEKSGNVTVNADGSKAINWKVVFNKNKNVIYDFKLNDTMTPSSLKVDKDSIKIENSNGDNVTAQFIISNPENGSFIVSKDKLDNMQYTLTYTTGLSAKEEAQEVKNIATISYVGGADKAEKSINKPQLGVSKQAVSIDKTQTPKLINWKITANTDENNKFVNLQNAVLKDTIPADQKLVKESITVKRVGDDSYVLPTENIYKDDNSFSINLPNGAYQYEVTLQTTIESYPSVNEKIDRYSNRVQLTNENYNPVEDDTYIDYFSDGTNNKSAKTGEINDDTENVDWNLVVNPAGLPINNAKITDTLGAQSRSTYVPGSIKVDNENAQIELSSDNKSFVITFKTTDGRIDKPVKISYSTKLDEDVIGFVTISNTVTLTGGKDGKVIDTTTGETKTSQWTYGGGGEGKTLTLKVNKKSNNSANIPNAEFKIVRVANTGKEKVVAENAKTDGDGLINILSQRAGRYIITELSVPEGYEKATAPVYVIVGYDKDSSPLITPSNSNWDIKESQKTDTITIINKVINGNITANKVWQNGPNDRPTVWFRLYRNIDGETPTPVDGAEIKKLDNSTTKVEWSNLELYKELGNGKTAKYIYSVKEVDRDGKSYVPVNYEKTEDGLTVTNSYVTPKIDITGTKVWENGSKPSVELQLFRDGKALDRDEYTISLDGSEETPWTHTWTGLDKTDINGKAYKYTVDEVKVPDNYEKVVSEDGLTVTNKFVSPKVDIPVEKVWNDGNNQDGNRPDSIEVELLANGERVDIDNITLNVENQWKASFSDLPTLDSQGKDITYTVNEVGVPSSYKSEVSGDSTKGFTITNSYTPGKTNVKVNKVWDDSNNQDGIRPNSIEVQLYANGKEKGEAVELNVDNNWSRFFDNLDEKVAGKVIEYTVKETTEIPGYTTSIDDSDKSNVTITNSHTTEKTEFAGTKTWDDADNQDGVRPDSITVNLLANGQKVDSKEITSADDWSYSFTGLPKNESGKAIKYEVSEETVEGYDVKIDGFNITNTHTPETTEVTGTKTWDDNNNQDGIRPDSVTVNLLADGIPTGQTAEVNADTDWKYEFTDLPVFEVGSVGKKVVYTVTEDAVDGYQRTTPADAFDITNTHTPETTEVTGTKTWDDNNNQDGIRPDSIIVNLMANGKVVGTTKVSAETNWKYTFSNLPKHVVGSEGKEVIYTISENDVEGYTTTYNGFNIVNTHTPGKKGLTVTKAWEDDNDKDRLRSDFIEVQLYANSKAVGEPVKLSADNNWTTTWTDLDEKVSGMAVKYTVMEVTEVKGYTATVTVKDDSNIIITNTHTIKPKKSSKLPNNDLTGKGKLPQTGEVTTTTLSVLGGMLLVAIGGIWYTKRRGSKK